MALFVDGPAATIDDLTDQDSGLLDVSQTCGINVSTKLRLAHDEIATDLQLWLNRNKPSMEFVWVQALHIDQIVVTAPLKQWETMLALGLVYRDAYFAQLADRYQAKWDEYSKLGRNAYEKFVASGMGIVTTPMRRAAPPLLSGVAGPQKGGTFYASVAWVNAAGQEGAVSDASSITVSDGYLMTVSAMGAPAQAAGFHVYAGTTLDAMTLQNDVPLAPGAFFTYVPGEQTAGLQAGGGQAPDFTRPLYRTWLRG